MEALLKDSVRMIWLAQGYEPSYRTINRFRVNEEVKELLRQCFVQFRCQLVQEKLIKEEAIEKYSDNLVEKSNQIYDELLEKQIIPEIERESLEELSTEEH